MPDFIYTGVMETEKTRNRWETAQTSENCIACETLTTQRFALNSGDELAICETCSTRKCAQCDNSAEYCSACT